MTDQKGVIPPNALKWIEALESGEYKQGTGWLRRGNTYCCLGVACDISGLNGWVSDNSEGAEHFRYGGNETSLPPRVERHFSLRGAHGDPLGPKGPSLTTLNDDHCATFAEIAALLRANPADYFVQPGEGA